jgi:hypothetical protein
MSLPQRDREILRRLGAEVAQIASLPEQKSRADEWRRLNRLEHGKPLVWVNEICWNEMGDEVALRCESDLARDYEATMRCLIYQWRHLPVDMVVDDFIVCPLVVHESGYGITGDAELPDHSFGAKRYRSVIHSEKDVDRIKVPEVQVDREATLRQYAIIEEALRGVLPVHVEGPRGFWFAPWDFLIQYWGIRELMVDMVDRPELVEYGISRTVDAHLARLDQYVAQDALTLNNNNVRVGSGGLGWSDQLPQPDFAGHVRPADLWGTATAQIFSDVSPAMHERFALKHERRWLERFGLNCYGCCEPLHRKIALLESSIPRLRRISMSPWVDAEAGAAAIGDRYVFSHKPNPAVVAAERWSPEAAAESLRYVLDRTRGCVVEVILKDISTVRGEPQRLWDWARVASEVTAEYA